MLVADGRMGAASDTRGLSVVADGTVGGMGSLEEGGAKCVCANIGIMGSGAAGMGVLGSGTDGAALNGDGGSGSADLGGSISFGGGGIGKVGGTGRGLDGGP